MADFGSRRVTGRMISLGRAAARPWHAVISNFPAADPRCRFLPLVRPERNQPRDDDDVLWQRFATSATWWHPDSLAPAAEAAMRRIAECNNLASGEA